MSDHAEKSRLKQRHEQMIYWLSIAMDVTLPRDKSGVYVLGYVKSGTNWLCNLLSDILVMPVLEPWTLTWPQIKPCVYHMHRFIPVDSVRQRTVYIMRDGRDTLVSKYFHLVREGGELKTRFERELQCPLLAENIQENMSAFILFMQKNRVSSTDYRVHLEEWKKHSDKYITVRYEDLLTHPEAELMRILGRLTHHTATLAKVREAINKQDFSAITNRKRGEQDLGSFNRKGISGDWRNYFTPESAKAYDSYAGDLLLETGYETDRQWWRMPSCLVG